MSARRARYACTIGMNNGARDKGQERVKKNARAELFIATELERQEGVE